MSVFDIQLRATDKRLMPNARIPAIDMQNLIQSGTGQGGGTGPGISYTAKEDSVVIAGEHDYRYPFTIDNVTLQTMTGGGTHTAWYLRRGQTFSCTVTALYGYRIFGLKYE